MEELVDKLPREMPRCKITRAVSWYYIDIGLRQMVHDVHFDVVAPIFTSLCKSQVEAPAYFRLRGRSQHRADLFGAAATDPKRSRVEAYNASICIER